VAVEEREGDVVQQRGQLVLVPQALTRDWGGIARLSMPPARCLSVSMADRAMPAASGGIEYDVHASRDTYQQSMEPAAAPPESSSRADRISYRRAFRHSPRDAGADVLTLLQRADGSWGLEEDLARAVGVKLGGLRKLAKGLGEIPDADRVIATAAALAYLDEKARDSRHEWHLLAHKALMWLDAAIAGSGRPPEDIIDLVRPLL
jgi:hypothetical protein